MMRPTIILDHIGDREVAARLERGRLEDLLIDDESQPRPGAIFRAICDRPMKGQGGMMLRLPGGSGFLRQGKGLAPGQPLLVQVTGYAEDGKATPCTDRVLFKSRYAIVTPGAPGLNISRAIKDEDERLRLRALAEEAGVEGLILRSSCAGAPDEEIAEDIAAMADLCAAIQDDAVGTEPEALTEGDGPHALAWREWTEPADIVTDPGGLEREGAMDQIDALHDPVERLDAGWMAVEPTRALVAVDVNTGGDTSPAAGLKANLAAVKALPRALRLRGLGGQITVDMAPLPKGQRRQVESALRAALKTDPVETSFVGWTPLGHMELMRKRERLPVLPLLR
ncbi:MAG: ribonuclease G [Rhodobacterales bacterium]|nr:MAG: ribonuclease G [Rhodobacterales bacterium]